MAIFNKPFNRNISAIKAIAWWRCLSLAGIFLASNMTGASAAEQQTIRPTNIQSTDRAKDQILSPLQLDSDFKHSDIPPLAPPTLLREPTITLKGAVAEAEVSNRTIREAQFEVARFKWDYVALQVRRLPNVRVIANLAQQTVPSLLIPARANAFVMTSALLPVTQQYRFGLEAKLIKLTHDIALYKLDQQIDDVQAKVKAAYYKIVLDQSELNSVESTIKYLSELATVVEERIKNGDSLKVDAMKVQARLSKSTLEQTHLKNNLQVDCEKLNHLLGRAISTDVKVETIPGPDNFELNVKEAEERAIANRPELRIANANARRIRLEKKIALSEYIPNVSIGAIYITTPGFNNALVPKNILAPGIFINYNAFDWGRKAFLARAASKNEQAALLNKSNVQDEVLIDLHTQINKLSEARLALKTESYAREVALEDVRVSTNRYKVTEEKLAEVLESQTALALANENYHKALLAFWNAKAEFDRAMGQ